MDAPQESSRNEKTVNAGSGTEYPVDAMQCETTRLMTAVREGDHEAFSDLERALRGRAFHVARSLVGSREDALELCQETFLKVFRSRDTYDPGQPFLPWFHRILRNTCFSFLRKHRRLKKSSLSGVDSDGEDVDFEIVDLAPSPSANAVESERAVLLRDALERLSARDREILALRQFQELSYKEISRTLDIPEGTVMSRLYHARRRLAEALAPLLDEVPVQVKDTKPRKGARK